VGHPPVQGTTNLASGLYGAGKKGVLTSAALTIAGFIPGVGTAVAAVQTLIDAPKLIVTIAKCL